MAYLRKDREVVEIDYPLSKVWDAIPKAIARLDYSIEEKNDETHHLKLKTKKAFLAWESILFIDVIEVSEKTSKVTVSMETPVTSITAMADFGRTRERMDNFFEALSKQLTP